MIRGAPIGKRFEHCAFDNFDVTDENRDAVEACKRVVETGETGVLIRGKHGLGKTHLLVAMMREYDRRYSVIPRGQSVEAGMIAAASVSEIIRAAEDEIDESNEAPALSPDEIEQQAHVEYWPMLDLTSELRSDIAHGSQDTSRRCRECDLLVLDDFGAERATEFVLEELERIVDWRYRTMKLMAIATNLLSFQAIIAKYGSRAFSRWMGSCIAVAIGGEDRRAVMGPEL